MDRHSIAGPWMKVPPGDATKQRNDAATLTLKKGGKVVYWVSCNYVCSVGKGALSHTQPALCASGERCGGHPDGQHDGRSGGSDDGLVVFW